MQKFRLASFLATASLGTVALVAAPPAAARDADRHVYHLPSQSLADALRAVSAASGRAVIAPAELLAGKTSAAIDGAFATRDAVTALLAGSGLRARPVANGFIVELDDPQSSSASADGEIIVTGSRIRGARNPSPLIEVGREAMKDSGRTTVADVIRSIPQNFGGGQNPGLGFNVPQSSGADVGGGSSVNLRGLGSDATLTLLDGRRLAYSAALQSVDISAIPFGAIERIEIVPDGASTIYGSDAVAGVVNVILRPRFSGLETSAKISGSTDGGNFEQQYGAVAGADWSSGGVFAAYEFNRNTATLAGQRDYAAAIRPGVTLYPELRRNNVAGRVRQQITPTLTFSVDGLFNTRSTSNTFPLNAAGDLSVSAGRSFYTTHGFTVAPVLELALPAAWRATLSGSYGSGKTDYGADYIFGATRLSAGAGFFRNRGTTLELSGDGNLLRLPGGVAKLAVGAGFRRNTFERFTGVGVASNIDQQQESYYGFAELSAPLLPKLVASGAVRYERYRGLGSVATPKFGLIYSLVPDFDIKGSWGQSFRAPTLYLQYQPPFAYLAPANQYGGSASAAVLYITGGNTDLRPERSTNWSLSFDLHPRAMRGFDLQVSYFSIDYTDRIVTPILFPSTSLTNAAYAPYVTLAPSAAVQTAFINSAATFTNLVGGTYDPTTVVALVRNNYVNAGAQTINGVDAQMRYKTKSGDSDFGALLDVSYLSSKQQITSSQPVTPLAGILFNPPKFRGRGELSWQRGGLGVVANLNFIGPVRDSRVAGQSIRVAGMTPVDLTIRYRTPADKGLLGGLDFILSAQNLFNEAPSRIATTNFLDTPYDSTNYSAFGRVLSLSVSKKW